MAKKNNKPAGKPAKKPAASERTVEQLRAELAAAHDELNKTNSELIQLTLELEDRVDERTEALRRSEAELRRHRDHLQELVDERTRELKAVNETLKKKLDELQASEERFRSLVLTIPDIVYRIDREGRFTFINDAIHKLGYDSADLAGKHFSKIILPVDVKRISRSQVLPEFQGKITGEEGAPKLFDERRTGRRKTTGLEVRLVTKENQIRPGLVEKIGSDSVTVEINSAGLYGIDDLETRKKVLVGTVGVIRDISDRKKIENALKESQDRLRTILNYAQAAIVVIDAETRRIVEANPAALSLIGANQHKVIGSICHEFICPREKGQCPVLDMGRRVDNTERTLRRADGKEIPILKTAAPVQLDGRPHLLESFVDISRLKKVEKELKSARDDLEIKVEERTAELKKSQAKLIQAEKIAAVGTLTAGIAHELNNPMMGMLNFIQYCRKHIDPEHRIFGVLNDAEQETRRCVKIVQNLLTFSRIEDQENEVLQHISLENLFERVCRLLSYRIEKENVTVIKEVPDSIPKIKAKISNIQQVFLNLMGNAMDAMKESEKREIRFAVDTDNGAVRITFQDTGAGIPEENVDKIFDPFFTTKPVGQGTGLGLSVTQGIIRDHGGTIVVENRNGKGTAIVITLPNEKLNIEQ